jgi:hypothetical protein
MTDRELLELSAKAAGLVNPRYHESQGWDYESPTGILHDTNGGRETHQWNPLTDDAHALRLAVKLQLCILPCDGAAIIETPLGYPDVSEPCTAETRLAAVRRAIVKAAAAMGEHA